MSLLKYIKKRISSDELNAVVNNVAVEPKKSAKHVTRETESASTNLEKREEIKRRLATPLNPDDFYKLEDALLLIAEEQPTVARSTPKNQIPNNSTDAANRLWSEKEMAHCLFDRPFYNAMIENSLKTCEQLQENLDVYVTEVRKSASTHFDTTT